MPKENFTKLDQLLNDPRLWEAFNERGAQAFLETECPDASRVITPEERRRFEAILQAACAAGRSSSGENGET